MTRACTIAIGVLMAWSVLHAQAVDPTRFEVASIKRNQSVDPGIGGPGCDVAYRRTNITLLSVLVEAYERRFFRHEIVGGPGWIATDKFDIVAKHNTLKCSESMVRALLADRFRLRVHEDLREQDVYRLVVDRRDGRLGPKLVRSTIDREQDSKLPPEEHRCVYGISPGRFNGRCASVEYLLRSTLSSTVQRRVFDQTGLTGTFDIDLTWDPALDASADQHGAGDAPSIFTALREQLGLRLEPGKARLPVLVIDSVQPPTEN